MATSDLAASTVAISNADERDRDRIMSMFMLAYARDPICRWTYPDAHDYLTYMPPTFDALGGRAYGCGTAQYAEAYAGAALWLPPGVGADGEAMGEVVGQSLSPRIQELLGRAFEEMDRAHPTEPHWRLAVLGVDANHQGRGYGAALLSAMLQRIDEERAITTLESTNPANVPFYERAGFEITAEVRIPDGPTFHAMTRPARSSRPAHQ